MELDVCILGSSSALPTVGRNPSSQFVTLANRHFLLDCGEGTQVQLRKNNIGFGRINHIFISHLHGDHYFGLLPLLSSLHLLDRQKGIHLYGPPELQEVLQMQMKITSIWLRYPLHFHPLERGGAQLIYEDEKVEAISFPLKHSLDCWGFCLREKERERNMKREALRKYSIPVSEIRQIKKGADWVSESGEIIPNQSLTHQGPPPLSYAYVTDTLPLDLSSYISEVDLLYHESTFLEQHKKRAKETNHSTAKQAAEVAEKLQAKHLLLGHYSTRYDDLTPLLEEARAVFPSAHLSHEGWSYRIKAQKSGQLLTQAPMKRALSSDRA